MERVKLTAREGMVYTDGKTYGIEVFLAVGDSADNWYEITEAEAEARQADIPTEDEATAEDYQSALREMGVDL